MIAQGLANMSENCSSHPSVAFALLMVELRESSTTTNKNKANKKLNELANKAEQHLFKIIANPDFRKNYQNDAGEGYTYLMDNLKETNDICNEFRIRMSTTSYCSAVQCGRMRQNRGNVPIENNELSVHVPEDAININLDDLLNHYFKPDLRYMRKYPELECHAYDDNIFERTFIEEIPKHLVIQLKRPMEGRRTPVNFPLELNISP
jgi:uncharacterized UBP type Zn finger protein